MWKYLPDYAQNLPEGKEFINGFLSPDRNSERPIHLLEAGEGVRKNCLSSAAKYAIAHALTAYFQQQDLPGFKQWASVAAKLLIMREHEAPYSFNFEEWLWPLLSDNEELISWMSQHRLYGIDPAQPGAEHKIDSHAYARTIDLHLIRGDMAAVIQACERALAEPEKFAKMKGRLQHFRFFLALAQGNRAEMATILHDMCSRKQRSRSFQFELPLTAYFIVSYATLLAKLAYRHGYELEIDTPWIPRDWLPVQALPRYEDPWPFMQRFDIWQPFAEPLSAWSPRKPV